MIVVRLWCVPCRMFPGRTPVSRSSMYFEHRQHAADGPLAHVNNYGCKRAVYTKLVHPRTSEICSLLSTALIWTLSRRDVAHSPSV